MKSGVCRRTKIRQKQTNDKDVELKPSDSTFKITRKPTRRSTPKFCPSRPSKEDLLVVCTFLGYIDETNCLDVTIGYLLGDTIPAQIGLLSKLTSLSIRNVNGTIPSMIGSLSKLTGLVIGSGITGTIQLQYDFIW
jgi:hypothetical protein